MTHPVPPPTNPSHAMATAVIDELVRCGLRDLCLSPGSRSAALALAAEENPSLRTHVVLDERSMSFLALGIARVSRSPTAVLTTSGTATANLHPAVIEADASRVPLLVLTADRPPEQRETGANQTIDQPGLYGRAVRWAVDVGVAEDRADANAYWRSTVCHAWAAASGVGGPAGPVHLNLPFREPLVPEEIDSRGTTQGPFTHRISGRPDGEPWIRHRDAERRAPRATIEELAERVNGAERGLLVVGETETDPAPLVTLAAAAGWPLLAEPLSGARTGGNAIGAYDLILGGDPAEDLRPELVVRVGRANLSRPLQRLLSDDVGHVLIDRDAARLDPTRHVDTVIAADPAVTASRVTAALERRPVSSWLARWLDAERAAQTAIDGALAGAVQPNEPLTVRTLAASVPPGSAVVVGSSLPVRHLDRFMRPRIGVRVLGNRGASGIDGFVSTALGVARAHQGPTYAVCGDLSLLHDVGGLDAAGAEALVLVVLNNEGGGIFSRLPQADHPEHFERLFGTPHGRDLGRVVRAHGAVHQRVEEVGALRPAIETAAVAGGLQVIEVLTDRAAEADLDRSLVRAVRAAVDR